MGEAHGVEACSRRCGCGCCEVAQESVVVEAIGRMHTPSSRQVRTVTVFWLRCGGEISPSKRLSAWTAQLCIASPGVWKDSTHTEDRLYRTSYKEYNSIGDAAVVRTADMVALALDTLQRQQPTGQASSLSSHHRL